MCAPHRHGAAVFGFKEEKFTAFYPELPPRGYSIGLGAANIPTNLGAVITFSRNRVLKHRARRTVGSVSPCR